MRIESLASVQWPELEAETGGLWGPDDEERLQLQLEDNKEVAADAQADIWGADLHEACLLYTSPSPRDRG